MKIDKRTAATILKCIALDNKDRLDIKSAIAIALEGLENLPDEVTVETCGGDDEEGEHVNSIGGMPSARLPRLVGGRRAGIR